MFCSGLLNIPEKYTPILFAILRIANDKRMLEGKTNSLTSNILGWSTFLIIGISVVILFFTWSS